MAILVHPKEGINQIELNQFQEIPIGKKPKAKKVKIQRTQKKRISRKELKELGLYTLPKKKLLYNDYIPLNDLWNGYMLEQFGDDFKQLEEKFNFTHNQYEIMSGLLHKSDFHGAKIKVIQSKCPSMVGHKGIVIMETRDTLNIISKDNILRGEQVIHKLWRFLINIF